MKNVLMIISFFNYSLLACELNLNPDSSVLCKISFYPTEQPGTIPLKPRNETLLQLFPSENSEQANSKNKNLSDFVIGVPVNHPSGKTYIHWKIKNQPTVSDGNQQPFLREIRNIFPGNEGNKQHIPSYGIEYYDPENK